MRVEQARYGPATERCNPATGRNLIKDVPNGYAALGVNAMRFLRTREHSGSSAAAASSCCRSPAVLRCTRERRPDRIACGCGPGRLRLWCTNLDIRGPLSIRRDGLDAVMRRCGRPCDHPGRATWHARPNPAFRSSPRLRPLHAPSQSLIQPFCEPTHRMSFDILSEIFLTIKRSEENSSPVTFRSGCVE